MTLSIAEQQQDSEVTFERVEKIEAIASKVDDEAAAELRSLADEMISTARPVRVAVAADLLDLSKPTIGAWCERGVLAPADGSDSTVRMLDPQRLHTVLHIVKELRHLPGKPGNLVEQVWHRLQDQALLNSDAVREGLAAWRAGDVVEA